ncbi:MAG: ABC transporter ATP-binding protein [Elusimicrobia bacterium]|nr:ABC transporter ATP-binding protein [Elusimicrobiota bacterium]
MEKNKIIEFKNFSAGYGKKRVLKNITFAILPRRIYAVLGPNASGKTTLLKSLFREIPETSGEIKIRGKEISDLSVGQIAKKVSFCPAQTNFPFDFTVAEFVQMGRFAVSKNLWETNLDIKKAKNAMDAMGISDIKSKKITGISSGELQKTILAQIISKDTEIILLDEPTSHLDIKNRAELVGKLRDLKETFGKTIIATFHDLTEAINLADIFILLKKGEIMDILEKSQITDEKISALYETEIKILDENGLKAVMAQIEKD